METSFVLLQLCVLVFHCEAQRFSLPIKSPPPAAYSDANLLMTGCQRSLVEDSRREVVMLIDSKVTPYLLSTYGATCSCGDYAGWTEVVNLDMTKSNASCPRGWTLYPNPRSCGRNSTQLEASTSFPVRDNKAYSEVCGKVSAYQKGHPDAFGASGVESPEGLDGIYMDGLSLTHGPPMTRTHIWTLAAGAYISGSIRIPTCPCSNSTLLWPLTVPSFIGNNYFCESGNPGPSFSSSTIYQDNPLWDGKGCGLGSTCCQLPPYFCTSLPQATRNDLELRIMANELASGEDIRVFMVELYVK